MMDALMLGADRDLVAVWQKVNAPRFDRIMLKAKTTKVEPAKDGLKVSFEGAEAKTYDMILVSVGRVPNGKKIGADKAGVAVTERGFIESDSQMRTNVAHIYAIGDITKNRCSRTRRCTKGTSPPRPPRARNRTSTPESSLGGVHRPEIAWVGLTEDEAKKTAPRSGWRSSRGLPRGAPSPTPAMRASPS
jgi:dihydrolipoamide dehydrogenase